MTALKLRAALTAILLATASAGAAALVMAVPAQAQSSVRAVVGKPLTEAKALAGQKNWKAAMARSTRPRRCPTRRRPKIRSSPR